MVAHQPPSPRRGARVAAVWLATLLLGEAPRAAGAPTDPQPVILYSLAGDRLVPLACRDERGRLEPGRDCAGPNVGASVVVAGGARGVIAATADSGPCRQRVLMLAERVAGDYALWPPGAAPTLQRCPDAGCAELTLDLDGDAKPDRVRVRSGGRRARLEIRLGAHPRDVRRLLLPRSGDSSGLDEEIVLLGAVDLAGDGHAALWVGLRESPADGAGEGAVGDALLRWERGALVTVGDSLCFGD